jgi:hypothetical protein
LNRYITIVVLFFAVVAKAQQTEDIYLNRDYGFNYHYQADTTDLFHTSVRPYKRAQFKGDLNFKKEGFSKLSEKHRWNILPIIDAVSGYDISQKNYAGFIGGGAELLYEYNNKLGLNLNYQYLQAQPLSYIDSSFNQFGIIDGFGVAHRNPMGFAANAFTGYLSYTPNSIFNLQIGRGKHFWGDGYRSLLLSDNAMPMPYFRITTEFWRIKYINLFAQQTDIRDLYKYNKKYTATHYLDWSVSKRVSISLFETVIFLKQDTLLSRGFELNYLNPIIFYRPVEYSLGSSDNVLMGMNLKVKLGKRTTTYGQLILDEFLLDEIKADTGWWANKYGGQLGIKSYDVFNLKGLYIQAEFNAVRPFTYSHANSLRGLTPINTVQNYGHANQSMAHPLGSSFFDYFLLLRYQKDKWIFENKTNISEFGRDTTAQSLGADIYKPYTLRAKEYRNNTTQGLHHLLFQNELRATYLLSEKYNLWASTGLLYRSLKNDIETQHNVFFNVSLRTSIGNRYYDY